MPEQYTPNIGHSPEESARRDCVHVAVAPVEAGEDLSPGAHVYVDSSQVAHGALPPGYRPRLPEDDDYPAPIGVVDPFLNVTVRKGERFWLFLYPGTITGLRHVWSHPGFKIKIPGSGESHP